MDGGARILVLVENLSVPMDRRVWQECSALKRAGHRVVVVCPQGVGRDEAAFEEIDDIAIHRYPLRAASGGVATYLTEYPAALFRTVRLSVQLARSEPFDVVHACNPPDLLFLVAWILRLLHGTRFVFDHHDLVPELYRSRFVDRQSGVLYRAVLVLERLTFWTADTVISTNESYRRVAIERGGVEPHRVVVVRSAPAVDRFEPVRPNPALKSGRPFLACYLGVMGPQDGVDFALRALASYRNDLGRDDLSAVFIGGGDAFDECLRLRDELGLGDWVEFTGRVDDATVIEHLSTADVCLAPDPLNPLNDVSTMNKIMEYMAMSRPIVSFDLVEARVSAGDAAVYATPNDEAEFARLVADLLDDAGRRESMGRIGRERVGGTLSWDNSERALLAAYDLTLSAGRGRRRARSRH